MNSLSWLNNLTWVECFCLIAESHQTDDNSICCPQCGEQVKHEGELCPECQQQQADIAREGDR